MKAVHKNYTCEYFFKFYVSWNLITGNLIRRKKTKYNLRNKTLSNLKPNLWQKYIYFKGKQDKQQYQLQSRELLQTESLKRN